MPFDAPLCFAKPAHHSSQAPSLATSQCVHPGLKVILTRTETGPYAYQSLFHTRVLDHLNPETADLNPEMLEANGKHDVKHTNRGHRATHAKFGRNKKVAQHMISTLSTFDVKGQSCNEWSQNLGVKLAALHDPFWTASGKTASSSKSTEIISKHAGLCRCCR